MVIYRTINSYMWCTSCNYSYVALYVYEAMYTIVVVCINIASKVVAATAI